MTCGNSFDSLKFISSLEAHQLPTTFASLAHSQRDRLAYLELHVWFLGKISRLDLVARFGIQVAAATRDLALYRQLAPENVAFDSKAKLYRITESFEPILSFSPQRALTWLANGFGDALTGIDGPIVSAGLQAPLAMPNLDTLSAFTRAISEGYPLRMDYTSLSSGLQRREIVPHALIDTGLRWHVRGFDRLTQSFRDFVINRAQRVVPVPSGNVLGAERQSEDPDWSRLLTLELVPHPAQRRPEVTRLDYGFESEVLTVKLRGAVAGYFLRKWSVDCTSDASLDGQEHRLWLKDNKLLYDLNSAWIAPGYK